MGNAGMEFEEEGLRPTYRLKMGQVGASRALEIAERSGLPAPILAAARAFLPEGEKHLKEVLRALEDEVAAHERQGARLKEKEAELEVARRDLAKAKRDVEQEKVKFLEGLPERLQAVEERFLEALKPEVNRQSVRRVAKAAAPPVVEAVREEMKVHKEDVVLPALPAPGDRVRVRVFGVLGTVTAVDGGTGKLTLDCDGKTLTVGQGDVDLVAKAPGETTRRVSGAYAAVRDAALEINLIGRTVAEAEAELEPFFDRASMAGLGQVRVIHGIGTGRLRAAVREWVKRSPLVESWEEAPQYGGGAGVTLVTLKA
jgi:DNA mismatch repair protein MutS2